MTGHRHRLGALDWTRGHGIPFDRSTVPPDDEVQDEICRVNGELDSLAASPFVLGAAAPGTPSLPPGVAGPLSTHGTGPARGQT